MKKLFMGATLALAATLVATPAMAAEDCVPKDSWSEVVVDQATVEPKEAVGEPTIVVPNPDYVPEVAEVSHNVEHPAETKLVEHPAETQIVHHEAEVHTEYHFAKYTQERTRVKIYGKWSDWSAWGEWTKWSPETHTSWELGQSPLGTPQFHSSGSRDNNQTQWERQWQAQWDGQTRQIEDKAAWDETVVVKPAWTETVVTKEAWTEKIIDVEYKEAIGEPTITIPNPEYVPAVEGKDAVTRTVVHAGVTCPATAKAVSSDDTDTLASTGGDVTPLLWAVGGSLALIAGGGWLLNRRRHAHVEE